MEPVDIVQKLLALATHNPSEEEATAAALKAVRLIVEHGIPIGGKATVRSSPTMTPEEQGEFSDVLSALSRPNPDEFKPAFVYPTTEVDDEFMKKRIIHAWRQIREMRKQLEIEINTYERETGRKYPR